jgi:hypothetical protein
VGRPSLEIKVWNGLSLANSLEIKVWNDLSLENSLEIKIWNTFLKRTIVSGRLGAWHSGRTC